MSKRTLAALVVGWLLGIGTALVMPTLVYQRQSIYLSDDKELRFEAALRDGWYVTRQDPGVYTLERPRFRLP